MAAVGLNVVRETLWRAGRRACPCSSQADSFLVFTFGSLDRAEDRATTRQRAGLLARVGPFALVAVAAEASLVLPPGTRVFRSYVLSRASRWRAVAVPERARLKSDRGRLHARANSSTVQ